MYWPLPVHVELLQTQIRTAPFQPVALFGVIGILGCIDCVALRLPSEVLVVTIVGDKLIDQSGETSDVA